METADTLLDSYAVRLRAELGNAVLRGHRLRGFNAVANLVEELRAVTPVGHLSGATAYQLLEEWIGRADELAEHEAAGSWSSYQWLWYLRRIGDEIFRGA